MAPSPGKFLSEIIAARLRSLEETRAQVPLGHVQQEAEKRTERRDFIGPLSAHGVNIIAEMKKASPSKGVLRKTTNRKPLPVPMSKPARRRFPS